MIIKPVTVGVKFGPVFFTPSFNNLMFFTFLVYHLGIWLLLLSQGMSAEASVGGDLLSYVV